MAFESNPGSPIDPRQPTAGHGAETPDQQAMGQKQLEAQQWAQAQGADPGAVPVLASQYLYKKYGILPNNGQGDWQHGAGGGAYGWKLENGDLVPADRSWFEKYGMLAITLGVMSAGTLSAALGGGAATTAGGAAGAAGPTAGASTATATGAGAAGAAATGAGLTGAAKTAGGILSNPIVGALTSAGLGGLEGLFSQHRQSFADGSSTDPRNILKQANSATSDLFGNLSSQLKNGVNLPDAHVQSPPSFAGPSLPMSFGITGSDPMPNGIHLGIDGKIGPADPAQAAPQNDQQKALAAFKMLGVNS